MHKVKYEGVSKFSEMKIFQNKIYGETFIGILIEVIHFVGKRNPINVFGLVLTKFWKLFTKTEQTAIQSTAAANCSYSKLLTIPEFLSFTLHKVTKSFRLEGSF